MRSVLKKKSKFEIASDGYRQIAAAKSKFPRFNTTQYVTRFVIEELGTDPEYELGLILEKLIDQAYDNTKKEYGRDPSMYNVLIDGQNLSQPIAISIRERVRGLEIEMVCVYKIN
jgi:hypothetical protein